MEDRNSTSHIYDKETSKKIFNRIKNNYSSEITKIIEGLKLTIEKLKSQDDTQTEEML